MSNNLLARFNIYCQTETLLVSTDFRDIDDPPTVCPNNNTHSVDLNLVSIIETTKTESVFINQGATNTQDIYRTVGYSINIPSLTPGDNYIYDITRKYHISPRVLHVFPTVDNIGDQITFTIAPETKIAELGIDQLIGQTTLSLTTGSASKALLGMMIKIDDGINSQELGECIGKDTDLDTITVEHALVDHYLAGTDILQSYIRVKDIPIANTNNFTIGASKFYSDSVPPNTVVRLIYRNNDGLSKTFNYTMEVFV